MQSTTNQTTAKFAYVCEDARVFASAPASCVAVEECVCAKSEQNDSVNEVSFSYGFIFADIAKAVSVFAYLLFIALFVLICAICGTVIGAFALNIRLCLIALALIICGGILCTDIIITEKTLLRKSKA